MKTSPIQNSQSYSVGPVALVAAKWHLEIVESLVQAAKTCVEEKTDQSPDVFWVPGSYEIPQFVCALAKTKRYRAIIPLGCLIKGETPHFDFIASTLFPSLDRIGQETGVAISVGVLTTHTFEQAKARAGGSVGNKGAEAALAALELAHQIEKIL